MQSMDKTAWTAGFLAGGVFAAQCPYVRGSFEALDWYGGWIEGAANALGHGPDEHSSCHDGMVPAVYPGFAHMSLH